MTRLSNPDISGAAQVAHYSIAVLVDERTAPPDKPKTNSGAGALSAEARGTGYYAGITSR
jgi:hypothetical protein